VGLFDWLFGTQSELDIAVPLAPPYPTVESQIDAYVQERMLGGSSTLPSVERGVQLLASAVAQLAPVTYTNGVPAARSPAIVERPDPWTTRYTFLTQTVRSMVETGDAFWYLFDHDPDPSSGGRARSARVLPSSEVDVRWDDSRFLPVYSWRGRRLVHGQDVAHIPLSPRPGELRGRSPLIECRGALLTIAAAETYAGSWFGGSGIPSGVLTAPTELDKPEADLLKTSWLEAHGGPVPTPAVLSGGVTWEAEAVDPERSQMTQSREAGVATVARLLGIPAPLLLVSLGGASITYANVSQLYAELHRSTVIPLYLSAIEAVWSDLVGRTSSVRFDLGELSRLDVTARIAAERELVDMGVLTAEDVALREGIVPTQVPAQLAPSPTPVEPANMPEVPAA
jgi:HK97 family phage portal protein